MPVSTSTMIEVELSVPGFHRWADAPEPVEFLQDRHRHIFQITARRKVGHDNRETEFLLLRDDLLNYLWGTFPRWGIDALEFGEMSCEMIGRLLLEEFDLDWVKVSEDGENGAVLIRETEATGPA